MAERYDFYLGEFIERGLRQLYEDMQTCPSAEEVKALLEISRSTENYEKKNCYFVKTLEIGFVFLQPGYYWAAEIYFRRMLEAIRGFELTHRAFNKGMVYVVLGIAEMENGKFDEGSAHLLETNEEDRDFEPGFEILEKPMWQRFESPILNYLQRFMDEDVLWDFNNRHLENPLLIDGAFLVSFLKGMSAEDRLFFDATFRSLLHNFEIINSIPNSYSYGRLYSTLKDICLLTESLLRKHWISLDPNERQGRRILLPALLTDAVGSQLFDRDRSYAVEGRQ